MYTENQIKGDNSMPQSVVQIKYFLTPRGGLYVRFFSHMDIVIIKIFYDAKAYGCISRIGLTNK